MVIASGRVHKDCSYLQTMNTDEGLLSSDFNWLDAES